MQSTARRTGAGSASRAAAGASRAAAGASRAAAGGSASGALTSRGPDETRLGVRLGLQHLAAAVEAGRADVMPQVRLAGGRLDGDARRGQRIVRAVHAALGGRLLVLLDGHG